MAIKSDRWIREMAEQHGMIEPFESGQVRENGNGKMIPYGTVRAENRDSRKDALI